MQSAYGNELHWTIKLISKKRVITYIGTYGQTGKCCYKNRQVRYKNKSIGTDSLTSIIVYMSYCLHIVHLLHYSLS